MKEIVRVLTEEKPQPQTAVSLVDWEELVFRLRDHEVAILSMIYLPKPHPVTYKQIYLRLRRLNYSQKTAKRKIRKLAGLGLFSTIRTVIGIINPVLDEAMVRNIQRLIELYNRRTSDEYLPHDPKYDELVELLGGEDGRH